MGDHITSDANGALNCPQLWSLVHQAFDATQGFDDTPNNGAVYEVWISTAPDFEATKTETFRVDVGGTPPPVAAKPTVRKDATSSFDRTSRGTLRGPPKRRSFSRWAAAQRRSTTRSP